MAETGTPDSVDRLKAVREIIEGLKAAYPDAKRLNISIDFDFAEPDDGGDSELCPVTKIEMER